MEGKEWGVKPRGFFLLPSHPTRHQQPVPGCDRCTQECLYETVLCSLSYLYSPIHFFSFVLSLYKLFYLLTHVKHVLTQSCVSGTRSLLSLMCSFFNTFLYSSVYSVIDALTSIRI